MATDREEKRPFYSYEIPERYLEITEKVVRIVRSSENREQLQTRLEDLKKETHESEVQKGINYAAKLMA
jgi:hypothetical protein